MTSKFKTNRPERLRFTRISDDCPICRLMEHLDQAGYLEALPLDGCDGLDGLGDAGASIFKGPEIEPFDRLTMAGARALLAALPPGGAVTVIGGAPSLAQMVALGERYPDLLLCGWRVDPRGPGDHVVVDGFYAPADCATRVVAELARRPDGCEALIVNGRAYWREWWR